MKGHSQRSVASDKELDNYVGGLPEIKFDHEFQAKAFYIIAEKVRTKWMRQFASACLRC